MGGLKILLQNHVILPLQIAVNKKKSDVLYLRFLCISEKKKWHQNKTKTNLEVISLCVIALFMAVIATGSVALFCQIPRSKHHHVGARWAVCQAARGGGGGGKALLHPANAAERKPARQLLEKNRELVKKWEKYLWSHWVEVELSLPLETQNSSGMGKEMWLEGWARVVGG